MRALYLHGPDRRSVLTLILSILRFGCLFIDFTSDSVAYEQTLEEMNKLHKKKDGQ